MYIYIRIIFNKFNEVLKMAIHTFSTRRTKPTEVETVERIKKYCEVKGLNFSALVVRLLIEWEETNNVRTDKV